MRVPEKVKDGPSGQPESRSNTFPGSERVKSDPRSIDTSGIWFPAASMLESSDFVVEKCGCFRGPKTDVHFAGKVLDLGSGERPPDDKPAAEMG